MKQTTEKIIIETIDVPMTTALNCVQQVIQQGRVSDNGKQYAGICTFGNDQQGHIIVEAFLNKKSDKFIVYNQ